MIALVGPPAELAEYQKLTGLTLQYETVVVPSVPPKAPEVPEPLISTARYGNIFEAWKTKYRDQGLTTEQMLEDRDFRLAFESSLPEMKRWRFAKGNGRTRGQMLSNMLNNSWKHRVRIEKRYGQAQVYYLK